MKKIMTAVLMLGLGFMPLVHAAEKHRESKPEKIPDTVVSIWSKVTDHEAELGKIIANKKLNQVHEVAYEIRNMVNALPDKSKDLPANKLAKVKAFAKYVAEIAERLDKSGDAGDQSGTEANFKKLQSLLKTIAAQYPPDVLARAEKAEPKE